MCGSDLCIDDTDDIDELVDSMVRDLMYWQSLENNDDNNETRCSMIYKVLQCIRASDPNAYEPTVLSIGPYHHGDPSFLPMEKEKWLCLDYVLKLNCNRSLHDYLAVITAVEREARFCYSDYNIMSNKTFVEMLLLDSCFILVCLNGIGEVKVEVDTATASMVRDKGKKRLEDSLPGPSCETNEALTIEMIKDHVVFHPHKKLDYSMDSYSGQNRENDGPAEQLYNSSAVYDLLLLENQIPFFVVRKIYGLLVAGERTAHRLLTDNLCKFIEGILLHFPLAIQGTNRPEDFDHLLHLCYMYLKPSRSPRQEHQMKKRTRYIRTLLFWAFKYSGGTFYSQEEVNPRTDAFSEDVYSVKEFQRWRRAEQYHDAGVEFKDREFDEDSPHSLLDIEFRDGVLHVPCLPIDDKSATLFRNLLAFEQSCPALGNDIAAYVYFLSQLISVPDDVALLSRKGVIVHQLESDEEVSTIFAKLFEYVLFDSSDHYLRSLCETMEAHYQNRLNRWMAWLWHKHFGNPWLGFAALASVFMVFCSIGQTVLAFLSYLSM